ncbi:nuclear transport factor 2 family protein [Cupriavidus sp. PET2-C1]
MTKTQIPASVDDLSRRMAALEAEGAARRTLSRYMSLCDVPAPADACNGDGELPALFTDDAVWEGVGTEYASGFGRHVGPAAIGGFLRKYLPPVPHFQRNVHCLTSEAMVADGDVVRGRWIMQQLSVYVGGKTELISARLAVKFAIGSDGAARMRHFQTERLSCLTLAEAPQ